MIKRCASWTGGPRYCCLRECRSLLRLCSNTASRSLLLLSTCFPSHYSLFWLFDPIIVS